MASVAQAVAGGRGFLSRRNVGGLAVVGRARLKSPRIKMGMRVADLYN